LLVTSHSQVQVPMAMYRAATASRRLCKGEAKASFATEQGTFVR